MKAKRKLLHKSNMSVFSSIQESENLFKAYTDASVCPLEGFSFTEHIGRWVCIGSSLSADFP